MRKLSILIVLCLFFSTSTNLFSQTLQRKKVDVPSVPAGTIKIDGKMDETAWQKAAHADILTSTGSEGFFNHYYAYGDPLKEPDYKSIYGRMLWSKDTLYLFYHVQEVKNDTLGLFFAGPFGADQIFVDLSNRLGVEKLEGSYNGAPYAAPNGPYHFFIFGDSVTLNGTNKTAVPPEYRRFPGDTTRIFYAKDIARWATHIDTTTATWDLEMAIYNPDINAQSNIGFNLGGSQGARKEQAPGDHTYSYYTWQPNTPNDPYSTANDPVGNDDPGYYNLVTSKYWALLNFVASPSDSAYVRKVVDVPMADSGAIKIDGKMDETAWQKAAHADILTSTGSEGFFNHYYAYGDPLKEPDYKLIYGRMLWSKDTLYLFYHVQEVKNDTLGLFFAGPFGADQIFVSLSNRLGVEKLEGSYNGAPYAAPNGPYHFFVYGDSVTLNGTDSTAVPPEYRRFPGDTTRVFYAKNIARWATHIDTTTATWDLEMAIYNPDINAQSNIGFNLGGSQGARKEMAPGDHTYSYYTWQPNTPNDPYSTANDPVGNDDPGYYNLVTSKYWPLLNFVSTATGVESEKLSNAVPSKFDLMQNYPNPFNPSTSIRFNVAKFGPVTLKIFNVVGQLVATLVNGKELAPGSYAVIWNANNLSSGVYLYSLEAGGIVVTKKMMLLK